MERSKGEQVRRVERENKFYKGLHSQWRSRDRRKVTETRQIEGGEKREGRKSRKIFGSGERAVELVCG